MDRKDGAWRKASYSNGSGSCVEVGQAGSDIAVRDTKQDGRGPVLTFNVQSWRKFAAKVKADETA